MILAIDPGNVESAYVLMDDETYRPVEFDKVENHELLSKESQLEYDALVVEMVASYGMAVGKEVFQTCVWIGRFIQLAEQRGKPWYAIYRKDEKMNLCGSMQAKDSNIRQALVDRFGKTASGKGTKKDPDFFYGFRQDVWAAFAVGTTFIDKRKRESGYLKMALEQLE